MQITFDPLVPAECDAVAVFLNLTTATGPTSAERVAAIRTEIAQYLAEDATPAAPSAVPLPPPVPLTAAADLFSIAPVVPTAGIPLPSGAELPPVPIVPQPPVAPTVPSPATANLAELDKDGLPWNAEIHASTKQKNADGRWRQRRNLAPEVLERVTAELRALMAVPAASAVPLPPVVPTSPLTPAAPAMVPAPTGSVPLATTAPVPATVGDAAGNVPPVPLTSAPATVPTPTPPVPPAPIAAVPTAPATGAPVSFPDLMSKITGAVTARTLTEAKVHEVLQQTAGLGPTQIGLLAARSDLVQAVSQRIDHILAGSA
jgi:hypothetical protein